MVSPDILQILQSPDSAPALKSNIIQQILSQKARLSAQSQAAPPRPRPAPAAAGAPPAHAADAPHHQIDQAADTPQDPPAYYDPADDAPPLEAEPVAPMPVAHIIWLPNEQAKLVELRLEQEDKFRAANRHDLLWTSIAKEINPEISGTQCLNKWKYIKSKYTKHLDGQNSTGNARLPAPMFFEQLDRVYGTRAVNRPKKLMDSMRPKEAVDMVDAVEVVGGNDDNGAGPGVAKVGEPRPKKQKLSDRVSPQDKVVIQIQEMQEGQIRVENMMERHHGERLTCMNRFLDLFEKSVNHHT
ncbi:uncharacterized protein LOC135489579 [Lineus longissimus]|uniref:uncharacterized protein LOC135489579 n=1 Tax=Lineus longissimus TaxID=88925 RepID=UPI00315C5521